MRAVLCLLVLAACARGQVRTPQPIDSSEHGWMPDTTVHVDSVLAKAAWEYVLACTGLTPQPGGQLEDVTWQVAMQGSLYTKWADSAGNVLLSPALGLWVRPDTIIVEAQAAASWWTLAHELSHHLLRGPPRDQGGPHPWFPFAFPCQLMPQQHMAGPLMNEHVAP